MAPLTLIERTAVTALSKLLYNFLPASGNNSTSFPIAAAQAGIPESWPLGRSKGPGIEGMLEWTLANKRAHLSRLIETIVGQSLSYRSRSANPLTREEVESVSTILTGLRIEIPAISDRAFLESLPRGLAPTTSPTATSTSVPTVPVAILESLERRHLELAALDPAPRGYAFERFLTELFAAYNLAPRGSFRLVGEQIDGSFNLDNEIYLVEAKWTNTRTGVEDLHAFTGKVQNKATWARGLFISNSGFSEDGLIAYGKQKPVICMDGYDLNETLRRRISILDVLRSKIRRAAESGNPMTHVRDLIP